MATTSKYFSKELNLTPYRFKQNILPNQVFYIINKENSCQIYCTDINVPNEIMFENIFTNTLFKKGKVYTIISIESDHFVINDQIVLKSYERIAWKPAVPEVKPEPIVVEQKVEVKPEVKPEPKKIKKSLPTSVKDCIWNYYIGQHINIHKCFCCKKHMIKK
jgi:hypothetical protein